MSELTSEHFDETMRSIADTLTEHGGRFDRIDARLDSIDTTLADHTARLDRLEQLLGVKDRLDRIEIVLAEQFGRDVLARAGL